MKMLPIAAIMLMLLPSISSAYTHEIHSGYTAGVTLKEYEFLWMTGGGVGSIDLYAHSSAKIEGTSDLIQGSGGIWDIMAAGYSHLDFYGGEVQQLGMGSYATATLKGGRINSLRTHQGAGYPYIDLYCLDWYHNDLTNLLTGHWSDGSAFSIQLLDVAGTVKNIDNINFIIIPEPVTMLLLGLGGLLIRRKI